MSPIGPIGPMSPMSLIGPIGPIRPISLISLIALTLTSCSGDSEDSYQAPIATAQTAISFSGNLPESKTVTRSQGLESQATTFQVWGYKNDAFENSSYTSYQTVIPGFTVNYGANTAYTTTSNKSDWEYVGQAAGQDIKYWDWNAKAYRFFAVAGATTAYSAYTPNGPYDPNGANEANKLTAATVSFTADCTTAEKETATPFFSRLWFSTGNTTDYPDKGWGQPVKLEFLKPFAQVTVEFHDSEGILWANEKIESFSFKPTDSEKKIANKGNVVVSYPLIGADTQETLAVTADGYMAAGITNTNLASRTQTVLPTGTDLGTFTIAVKLADTDQKTAVVPAAYMQWKPGYSYTYIFKVSGETPVVLEVVLVAIKNWAIGSEFNHEVYNW